MSGPGPRSVRSFGIDGLGTGHLLTDGFRPEGFFLGVVSRDWNSDWRPLRDLGLSAPPPGGLMSQLGWGEAVLVAPRSSTASEELTYALGTFDGAFGERRPLGRLVGPFASDADPTGGTVVLFSSEPGALGLAERPRDGEFTMREIATHGGVSAVAVDVTTLGAAVVAWIEGRSVMAEVRPARSRRWSPPRRILKVSGVAPLPTLKAAVGGQGQAVVAFASIDAGTSVQRYRASVRSRGGWRRIPLAKFRAATLGHRPGVAAAVDTAGNTWVAWRSRDAVRVGALAGGAVRVVGAFDAHAPRIDGLATGRSGGIAAVWTEISGPHVAWSQDMRRFGAPTALLPPGERPTHGASAVAFDFPSSEPLVAWPSAGSASRYATRVRIARGSP